MAVLVRIGVVAKKAVFFIRGVIFKGRRLSDMAVCCKPPPVPKGSVYIYIYIYIYIHIYIYIYICI